MPPMSRPCARAARPIRAALLAITLAGCGDSDKALFNPLLTLVGPPRAPVADSPAGAVRRLVWCYQRKQIESYSDLFTADFRFLFGQLDPYGEPYLDVPWTREDERISFEHLVLGGAANQPPASSITLTMDPSLLVTDDPRPGKDPRWHRQIRTSVFLLLLDASQAQTTISGYAVFQLVRGDSASIPEDLLARGVVPDSTRWYIERWEDGTAQGLGARALPTRSATWGQLKALYR